MIKVSDLIVVPFPQENAYSLLEEEAIAENLPCRGKVIVLCTTRLPQSLVPWEFRHVRMRKKRWISNALVGAIKVDRVRRNGDNIFCGDVRKRLLFHKPFRVGSEIEFIPGIYGYKDLGDSLLNKSAFNRIVDSLNRHWS